MRIVTYDLLFCDFCDFRLQIWQEAEKIPFPCLLEVPVQRSSISTVQQVVLPVGSGFRHDMCVPRATIGGLKSSEEAPHPGGSVNGGTLLSLDGFCEQENPNLKLMINMITRGTPISGNLHLSSMCYVVFIREYRSKFDPSDAADPISIYHGQHMPRRLFWSK